MSGSETERGGQIEAARVREYLDSCIRFWRHDTRDCADYYVDAFQSVRVSLLGELLPSEDEQVRCA